MLKKKQQPRTRRDSSCRSLKLLIKLKNKTLLILLTSTSSQASTGSSTPESIISLSLVQAPEASNPVSYTSLCFSLILFTCAFKLIGVVVTPRMHVVGLIYPILDNPLMIIMVGSNALLSAIVSLEVE